MIVGLCAGCGLTQLCQAVPSDEIRPRYDWIVYNEPDGHLDQLVEELARLPGITTNSLIGGVVFGGDSTLSRFRERGFNRTWRIDLERDLGVSDCNAGVETIQEKLTPSVADRIAQQNGTVDLLIVRHMLEHAHNLRTFLEAIKRLVRPTGYVVFEVPDCEKPFSNCDYSILWEEHIFYFMPETLRFSMRRAGFEVLDLQRPPYSLVAIAQPVQGTPDQPIIPPQLLATEQQRLATFATSFIDRQQRVAAFLTDTRAIKGKIAFFGAGHLSCVYINLLRLQDQIEFVVDDHPKKQGLFMPGSHLPIYGSAALVEQDIRVCLSTLSPESEFKVSRNNQQFVKNGGSFLSIFPGRPNSLSLADGI